MKFLTSYLLIGAISLLSFKTDHLSGYEIGDTAVDFSLINASETVKGVGKEVSLADYKDAKGFIVIFTCNHCPFSKAYEDRIIRLQSKYESQGVPVVAINPNEETKTPDDSYPNMKIRAKEKGFNFAYLHDSTQEIAKTYGAKKTPHVFLLDAERVVKYIGSIDDSSWTEESIKEKYVEDAVDAMLAGKEIVKTSSKAVGCTIKWKE
jgi:thiol-disulfide isomerase/thioredoxin